MAPTGSSDALRECCVSRDTLLSVPAGSFFWTPLLSFSSFVVMHILYQLLVLSPIPFSRALCYSVWISSNSFYVFSNKDIYKKNIRTGQTHSSTFSALLPPAWVLGGSWANIRFHHSSSISVTKVNNIQTAFEFKEGKKKTHFKKPYYIENFMCFDISSYRYFYTSLKLDSTWLFWITVADLIKTCGDQNPFKRSLGISLWSYRLSLCPNNLLP